MFYHRFSRDFRVMTLAVCFLNALLLTASLSHAQTITPATGIFAIDPFTGPYNLDPVILADPYVKGVLITTNWSDLETSEKVYTWTLIDAVLAQAGASGKVVTLGVMAGVNTPSWVYADGAQSFKFVWDKSTNSPVICSVQPTPIPWDPVFLAKWQTFVNALGARYNANATLVSVMLYGLNFHSVETSLPASNGEKIRGNGKSCTGYNYPVQWQAAGYTRTRVENAIFTMQGYFQRAFPHKQLLAGLNPGGFPPIDQNGNLIGKQAVDQQAPADLMAYGAVALGPQFSAGDGGLSTRGWTWPLLTQYASTVDTGYQTASPLGAALPTAINTAVAVGVRWLQLYRSDITLAANQPAIITASQELR